MRAIVPVMIFLMLTSTLAGCFESDSDGDGLNDADDNCPDIDNPLQADHDIAGGLDGGNECDEDDDNDGKLDIEDDCPVGDVGWNSSIVEFDSDSDGCKDSTEDLDDDNDGIYDQDDFCSTGETNWLSGAATDLDNDGCKDDGEDTDDDNDGIEDNLDFCPQGYIGWTSTPSLDWDNDGCHDINEDNDDDGDTWSDSDESSCGTDSLDSTSIPDDLDSDGICDSIDNDDDNDGVQDDEDVFPFDSSEWSDFDNDGIGDNLDSDDDNDGIEDENDMFPLDSSESSDYDLDGIGDNADTDDDNDGCPDATDAFPLDNTECFDFDSDGIGDIADTDDDNDGMLDIIDNCPLSFDMMVQSDAFAVMVHYNLGLSMLLDSWGASDPDLQGTADLDSDGCHVWEDTDDDDDGRIDGIPEDRSGEWWLYTSGDNCVIVYNPNQEDYDGDGKGDACDDDIDGDGIINSNDWHDYGNGIVSFSFTNFSVWSGGSYDSGGGLPDVYPYLGVGTWDGAQCNDLDYNDNYMNYIQNDAYQLENWLTIYWDVDDDISEICFSLTMYDEDSWAVDQILDFVPGSNNGDDDIFTLTVGNSMAYQYDNRGENSLSILLEFIVFTDSI